MHRSILVAGFLVGVVGCGASSSSGTDTAAVQGNSTSARPEVGMLLYNGSSACTATLIAPQAILSAAHCINENYFNDKLSFEIETPSGRHTYAIDQVHTFSSDGGIITASPGDKDVSVLHLTEAVPAALAKPAVIASANLSYSWVTEMGYGGAGWGCVEGSGPGNKRYHETFINGEGDNSDICGGDSGGPIFAGHLGDNGPIVALMTASGTWGDAYSYPPKILSAIASQLQAWGSPLPSQQPPPPPSVSGDGAFSGTCTAAETSLSDVNGAHAWATEDTYFRFTCDSTGTKVTEFCPNGVSYASGVIDDQCIGAGQPKCTAQEITAQHTTINGISASLWTCQGTSRYVCDAQGNKITEACSSGCMQGSAGHDSVCGCSAEMTADSMLAGGSFRSCDGRFTFAMQGDGNLVLYEGTQALWASRTSGSGAEYATLQGDGNLVLYTAARKPVWSSVTHDHPGAHLVVQDDGNVVIYDGTTPIWATHTAGH